jgi:hypothetical protein
MTIVAAIVVTAVMITTVIVAMVVPVAAVIVAAIVIATVVVTTIVVAAMVATAIVVTAVVMAAVVASGFRTLGLLHDALREPLLVGLASGHGRSAGEQRGDDQEGHWAFHLNLLGGIFIDPLRSQYRREHLSGR